MIFGIYPGLTGVEQSGAVVAGGRHPDDPARTRAALDALAGGRPFLVRCYLIFDGSPEPSSATPVNPTIYVGDGRKLDLVLCYRSASGDLGAWLDYVRRMVARFGLLADAIQITEEPNNPHTATGGDGSSPNVRQAMVDGVVAARQELDALGLQAKVGIAVTPSFNPADDFWPDVARRIGTQFLAALDYVGLDFFPDVFRPLPFADLETAVGAVLTHFRTVNLEAAGIPGTVPIRVTENGWPTGDGRPYDRQAEVLERVLRTVYRRRSASNVTHYEFFMLRDGDSDVPQMGSQWGLLKHDYTPKPAFDVYRRLIAELGD